MQLEKYRPLRGSMPSCRAQWRVVWHPWTVFLKKNVVMGLRTTCRNKLVFLPSSELMAPVKKKELYLVNWSLAGMGQMTRLYDDVWHLLFDCPGGCYTQFAAFYTIAADG